MQLSKEYVNNLLRHCNFSMVADETAEVNIFNRILEANHTIFFNRGASKIVLINYDWDSVLKIPFKYKYNTSNGEYNKFKGAKNLFGVPDWDYCAKEVELYEKAKMHKLDKYFAEIELISYIDGYPIYKQIRCSIAEERYCEEFELDKNWIEKQYTKEELDNVIDFCHKHLFTMFDNIWLADFVEWYGFDELYKLLKFIEKEDIDDLHSENIGYGPDGEPIIIDYSGWNN